MTLYAHRSLSLREATKLGHCRPGRSSRYSFASQANDQTAPGELCTTGNTAIRSPASNSKVTGQPRKSTAFISLILPFDRFSNSIFGVPVLLLFRLFYQASPYELSGVDLSAAPCLESNIRAQIQPSKPEPQDVLALLDKFAKHEAQQFYLEAKSVNATHSDWRVLSVTWVKALASSLSHEYLQFIIEDVRSGQRRRLVADRSDQGDLVIVGWNWASDAYASHHHKLPLPLLTLSYEATEYKPALLDVAASLAQISRQRPYNIMREMCWWYAETVFGAIHAAFPEGVVQQWPFGHLRYSFIVHTEWVQRKGLVAQAEKFRKQNMTSMRY